MQHSRGRTWGKRRWCRFLHPYPGKARLVHKKSQAGCLRKDFAVYIISELDIYVYMSKPLFVGARKIIQLGKINKESSYRCTNVCLISIALRSTISSLPLYSYLYHHLHLLPLHTHSPLNPRSSFLPVLLLLLPLLLQDLEAWTRRHDTWRPWHGVYSLLLDSLGSKARASPIVLFCVREERRREELGERKALKQGHKKKKTDINIKPRTALSAYNTTNDYL